MKKSIIVGIDLAGSPRRGTGFCIMDEKLNVRSCILHSDKEIINAINGIKPKPAIIAIDAPLSLPFGRNSLKKAKGGIHFRQCDLELRKLHIRFFPITLGPMRTLTSRGMKLKKQLKKYRVIEVYPGGAQDLLGIARKPKEVLLEGLRRLGIKGLSKDMNKDELDAVTCAFVGKCWVEHRYLALGNPKEGLIIMPMKKLFLAF